MKSLPKSSWLDQQLILLLLHKAHPGGYEEIIDWSSPDAIPPANCTLIHLSSNFAFHDPLIAEFAERHAQVMRVEGRLFDGPSALRLDSIEIGKKEMKLRVQPCDYALQAGSSFVLDIPDQLLAEYGGTLRNYLERKYPPTTQLRDMLPGCFGICGVVITRDRKLVVPKRGKKLASMACTWGPSVAGGVDYRVNFSNLDELFRFQLPLEIYEELGIENDEFTAQLTAFSLEGKRGLRPQLFALVETVLDSMELLFRMNQLSEEQREHDEIGWIRVDDPMRWSLDMAQSLNYEAAYALLAASRLPLKL